MSNSGTFHGTLKNSVNYEYVIDKNLVLKEISLDDISSQKSQIKPSFIITWKNMKAAVSFWVSAKRTRSYPYTRMFETLSKKEIKKITIFPVVKDEGYDGDRDYIQWDTFSICSYLGIYAIPAYYVKAIKNPNYTNKVTCQKFDSKFVTEKIKEILSTDMNPSDWNNKERNAIGELIDLIIGGYRKIQKETGVKFHDSGDLRKNLEKMNEPKSFKNNSQEKSSQAQNREHVTTQPKEEVFGLPKGKITLCDSKGGQYSWTVDAYHIKNRTVYLMEMKHAKKDIPSLGDIKDALFKFHFFANIEKLRDEEGKDLIPKPILVLSSGTESSDKIRNDKHIKLVIEEAKRNNIQVIASGKNTAKEELIAQLT